MTTRRDFLASSTLLGFGATVPSFLGKTALAAAPSTQTGSRETILVVVQLTGGNDGLNTVIPYKNDLYYKYRPSIAIPKDQVFGIGDELGLHPAFAAVGRLLNDRNAVTIVQGVGYPNSSQSHFRSMDIWQAGNTADTLPEGWIGQALKQKPYPAFHLGGANETSLLALNGAPVRVPSINSLADFQLKLGGATAADRAQQKAVLEAVTQGDAPAKNTHLLDFVRRTTMNTYASSDKLASLAKGYEPKSPYPESGFAQRLKLAAQLIDANVGARIVYVAHDGFDTHAGQGGAQGAHANLLKDVGEGIAAFYRDLAERGQAERVCIMTFSEFGRRAKENGSKGTDHGSGAPMFLIGGKLQAGIVGTHPALDKLEEGNLVHHTDFRRVYATVLSDWLGLDPRPILGDFAPLELFKV